MRPARLGTPREEKNSEAEGEGMAHSHFHIPAFETVAKSARCNDGKQTETQQPQEGVPPKERDVRDPRETDVCQRLAGER